jgi:hypothetical protein
LKPIIQLCIPQLLQPLKSWKQNFLFEVDLPVVEELLRRFEVVENKEVDGLEASLFNALGLAENQELPLAHYRYQSNLNQSNGASKSKTLKQYLCADPIHLEAGMNDITLTNVINDLTQNETDEILEDLNKHFAQDGLAFIQDSNQHCYIVLPENEDINTKPLSTVLRKNIANYQPHSEARNWRVIQNESQMILHSSEVNQQREIAGLPTLNSLWFWGGGKPLKSPDHNIVDVYYANETAKTNAKTIANAADCHYSFLTNDLPDFKEGKTLIILDHLFQAAINDNLDLYQQELTQLEKIITPFITAWKAGEIELLIDSCNGKILKPVKPKAWKFWERDMFLTLLQ